MSKYNFAHHYDPTFLIHAKAVTAATNDSIIVYLNISFDPNNKRTKTFNTREKWPMTYKLVSSYESKNWLRFDTLNLRRFPNPDKPGEFIFTFRIAKHIAETYYLMLNYFEEEAGELWYLDIPIKIMGRELTPHFTLFDKKGRFPLFNSWFSLRDSFQVIPTDAKVQQVYVKHFKYKFSPAYPPMAIDPPSEASLRFPPDSVYLFPTYTAIRLPIRGLYQFSSTRQSVTGPVLLSTDSRFPRLTKSEELVSPLIYMASDEERKSLRNAKNQKQRLDDFWLDLGGEKDFARKMIRNFYRKVQQANVLFTLYKEGWKTDMGMIYIIYGVPDEVVRQDSKETWYYEKRTSLPSLAFEFIRKGGPLNTQIFELQNSNEYAPIWYTAVDLWRKGILEK